MKITGNEYAQCQAGGMSAKELCESQFDGGLTIRQEFAARLMTGMMANPSSNGIKTTYIANMAVIAADALIAELNKPKT